MTGPLLLCWAVIAAGPAPQIHFDTQIVPILTKAGCNSGACHGAAAGRGGFHLSLLGGDPPADFEAIVQAFEGRRVNLDHPELSLLLAKPTGYLDHGGDLVFDEDSAPAERLLNWIRQGASRGATRRLTGLAVTPSVYIGVALPSAAPLHVVARFDDGPPEDVTEWTTFTSSDPAAVEIDERYVAHVKRRGQHVVIARFLDRVLPIQFNAPFSDKPVDLSNESRANFIDDEVLRVLSDLRIPVSPSASEREYLRRVTLDLTGRLPTPSEIDAYVSDDAFNKRERLVDDLLASDAYADYWTLRLARLLNLHSVPNDAVGVQTYASWLRNEIEQDVSLADVAERLITATGDSHENGPANFARMVPDARGQAELFGQFFLGARLGCANCHNHPLDRWTQDDYHGLAAVFAPLERGREVRFTSRGAVTNLRTGDPAIPRIPGERYLSNSGDHRDALAQWLVEDPHRYFARATVNRLWSAMFGRGLVEPTDDLRETNPPTHPELLDKLAEDFLRHDYSMRHTLRQIALSNTYARSSTVSAGNTMDDRFYSRAYFRPLMPEVLADAIADVTAAPNGFDGHPSDTRAVTLTNPLSPAPSLDILGRCTLVSGCDEIASSSIGLPAQLHMLNGDLVNRKLTDRSGRLQQLIVAGVKDAEIIREFYLRGLGRPPESNELQQWQERLANEDSLEHQRRLEDFVWSLLNSRQFMENH